MESLSVSKSALSFCLSKYSCRHCIPGHEGPGFYRISHEKWEQPIQSVRRGVLLECSLDAFATVFLVSTCGGLEGFGQGRVGLLSFPTNGQEVCHSS